MAADWHRKVGRVRGSESRRHSTEKNQSLWKIRLTLFGQVGLFVSEDVDSRRKH